MGFFPVVVDNCAYWSKITCLRLNIAFTDPMYKSFKFARYLLLMEIGLAHFKALFPLKSIYIGWSLMTSFSHPRYGRIQSEIGSLNSGVREIMSEYSRRSTTCIEI